MKTQFITDSKGKKVAVILPLFDYNKMIEDLEEREDIKLYDSVKKNKEERISFDDYLASRKKKHHA